MEMLRGMALIDKAYPNASESEVAQSSSKIYPYFLSSSAP